MAFNTSQADILRGKSWFNFVFASGGGGGSSGGSSTVVSSVMAGSPEGVKIGSPGDLYLDSDTDMRYVKKSGVATNTGWV